MAWTPPTTRITGELITAAIWNTDIVDNLDALKDPPTDHYEPDEGSDYTTSSTSFVDVDATNLALTITTTGGDVLIGVNGSMSQATQGYETFFEVDLDGSPVAGDDGIMVIESPSTNAYRRPVSFCWLVTSLAAGSHTFKLQWKVNAGTATFYAGAGTSSADVHPQMWVREVS